MALELTSPCKVNLILNILGRRPDDFHEIETIFQPVPLHDVLTFRRGGGGIQLTCNDPSLPIDAQNLVYRAASEFLKSAGLHEGVCIHLEKRIPKAAGLGGGSGNAAVTLLGLNEVFGEPLNRAQLHEAALRLGSDVPFFLQRAPALATGRGEHLEPLQPFRALNGVWIMLVHPGFGVSTGWAYQQLAQFPDALNGQPGRARKLAQLLDGVDLDAAAKEFYNAFEAPVLKKYPLLALFQDFFRENRAITLMSGSGSTTFALVQNRTEGETLIEKFKAHFGDRFWTALLPL